MFEGCPHHQLYEEGGEVGPRSEVQVLHCLLLWVVNLFKANNNRFCVYIIIL